MTLYRATAYVFFAAALLNVFAAMAYEAPIFIAAAFSGFAAGVFFLGLGRIIELLTELRGVGRPDAGCDSYSTITSNASSEPVATIPRTETKEVTEIRAALAELKGRL